MDGEVDGSHLARLFHEGGEVDGFGRTIQPKAAVQKFVSLDVALVRSVQHVE